MKGVHYMCPIPFLSPFMEIIGGFFINLYLQSCVLNKLEQHDLINRILSKDLDHLWLFWSACILEMTVLSVLFWGSYLESSAYNVLFYSYFLFMLHCFFLSSIFMFNGRMNPMSGIDGQATYKICIRLILWTHLQSLTKFMSVWFLLVF